MHKAVNHWIFIAFTCFSFSGLSAEENVGIPVKKQGSQVNKMVAGCAPASAQVDLDINNVRARIMNGGDMWWDLVGQARYEIPKVTEEGAIRRYSLFAGALWIGGYDAGNNLKLAAMTYRQSGSDFYPGPLDTQSATISVEECLQWDRIYEISRQEIQNYRETGEVTPGIRQWPGNGKSPGQAKFIAPFVDEDGDGVYNPDAGGGDYPDVFGDQTLWFVYNDKGNIHEESEAAPIGLEIQTQAFAFATNDEINNMTFYNNKIINRSRDALDSVYFGQWVDADLGYAFDDYVGCDVERSLGICYNGDNFDDGTNGYGSNPPSVGVDFFQGPTDENGNVLGMEKFVYYNNDFTATGNPEESQDFYNYLTGTWKDGTPITFGGSGYKTGSPASYMFPDDPRDANGWSEVTAGNRPADRRFLQSAGAFRLAPGAVNYVVTGAVWARASTGGATGSLDQLRLADDKAQKLYNNNFDLIDGPDAPDLVIQELDRQLVLILNNTQSIENYRDFEITEDGDTVYYSFQGYQIYQLANSNVQSTPSELANADLARLIIQVDVEDQVSQLINREFDPVIGQTNYVPMILDAANDGISHTFSITQDYFASGEDSLINYKSYYYMILAYANADNPDEDRQYLAGRLNVHTYTGIPHRNIAEFGGAVVGAEYGSGPELRRIEGMGNGGNILELTPETEDEILANTFVPEPVYAKGMGPVNVKVIDPLAVESAEFELSFSDPNISANPARGTLLTGQSKWTLTNLSTGESVESDTTAAGADEKVILKWGLSVTHKVAPEPGADTTDEENGFLNATMEYEDPSQRWLPGIPDGDGDFNGIANPLNWIRAGNVDDGGTAGEGTNDQTDDAYCGAANWLDENAVYETLLDGIVAPYALTAISDVNASRGGYTLGPKLGSHCDVSMNSLHSVDLVFTSDKSKWTRCVVIEMGEDPSNNVGGARKFDMRRSPSIDKDGNMADPSAAPSNNPDDPHYISAVGMGWFPGYAIDLETGQRLNILYGEDSFFKGENGDDMKWNPTATIQNSTAAGKNYLRYVMAGKHYTYVMAATGGLGAIDYSSAYDAGASYLSLLGQSGQPSPVHKRALYASAMWTLLPMSNPQYPMLSYEEGVVPNDMRMKLRVSQPLASYEVNDGQPVENNSLPLYRFSTENIQVVKSKEAGEEAMQMVQVVPNPYYAYSAYENSQVDSRVRITNLPPKVDISIYTLDGTLIRQYRKDESFENHVNFLDWDLKNHAGIPISSGIYIIHVDGGELGQKIIKWFGVMRPIDLDIF